MQSLLMLDLDSDIHDKLIVSPIIKPPHTTTAVCYRLPIIHMCCMVELSKT